MTEARPSNYWIASNALYITLNANGGPDYLLGNTASGAHILCYMKGIDGLEYDAGHNYRRWPLSLTPTHFETYTEKYVYCAIPRPGNAAEMAVIVFPSEKLDLYGKNETGQQIGSEQYYYIWLQGIISSSGITGANDRGWTQHIDTGTLASDEAIDAGGDQTWWRYSAVDDTVTFLKDIWMKAGTTFHNLILGYKELTGVATSDTAYTDSDVLVATPGYVESQYLSKTHESEAREQIGFLKGLWIGVRNLYEITANGIAKLKSVIAEDVNAQRVQTGEVKSPNYTGDGVADTGFRLTNAYNGHSKLTIDEIYVRMKAVFESLEVRERTYTGGDQIWSCAGNRVTRVDYLGNVETADHVPQMVNVHADGRPEGQGQGDVYSVPVPGDTYGYSDVKVPWLLRQMPLLARAKVFARYRKVRIVINEPAGSSANRAAASESPLANIRRARCYFLAKDDDMEVHNWWRINDLARCQTMNLANTTRQTYISGEDQKAGNIFWWRKVIGVSYEPVTLDDGKEYHYFDVSFDYEYEQSHPEVMATSVMEGSDIPAAQDSVVQFGNTIIEGRMNLMMMEVNGSDAVGYNPTTDAPCLKAYRGVYCFDLNKSWVGGNARKMMLSPKSGYEFYGPNFKQVTEYDVVPVPVDRGLWLNITPTRDDYREHAMVRKCYYYDKVSHNGSYWLCSIVDGAHWVDGNGDYLSDDAYSALTEEQKALCSRKQNYTIEEPSANSIDWTEVVQKGDKGDNMIRLDINNEMDMIPTTAALRIDTARTVETTVQLFDGATEVDISTATISPTGGPASSIATFSQSADGKGKKLSWAFIAGQTMAEAYDITISYTYKNVAYTAVFTVSASKGEAVWQLKPSMSAIPFQRNADNTLTPASREVGLSLLKIDGGSTATYTSVQTGLTVRYSTSSMPSSASAESDWSSGNITVANTAENVYIALFNASGVLLDRETIPVIKDGEKGDKGSDGPYYVDDYGIGASRTSHSDISSWSSSQPEPTAQKPYVWKRSRLYNPNTGAYGNATYVCLTGEKGVNGKDGWMVTADPANVIITQSLANNTSSFSSATVGFTAKKGSVAATITDVSVAGDKWNHFRGSAANNQVTVTAPTTDGSGNYYTEGSFEATVSVTDPDTGSTVTFSVTVLCYANLLGSWKDSVVADTKREVAQTTYYVYDKDGNVVKSQNIADYIKSSSMEQSSLSSTVTAQGGTITNLNTRISNAEGNISTVERKIPNPDLFNSTAWIVNIKVGSENKSADYDSQNARFYDASHSVDDIYSPIVALSAGKYTFSGFVPSDRDFETSGNTIVLCSGFTKPDESYTSIPADSVGVVSGETKVINGATYHRCFATFTLSSAANCSINLWGSARDGQVAYPKLEKGSDPTYMSIDSASYIKQTADEIEAKVNDTGINISTGEVTVFGGKFSMKPNKSSAATFELDSNGNLVSKGSAQFEGKVKATSGEFTGKITANDGSIGGFEIGATTIKSSNNNIVLNANGSATFKNGDFEIESGSNSIKVNSSGFEAKWGGEGFRVSSNGIERWDSVRNVWAPMYERKVAKVFKATSINLGSDENKSVNYVLNARVNWDNRAVVYLPNSTNVPNGTSIIVRGLARDCDSDVVPAQNSGDTILVGDYKVSSVGVLAADCAEFILCKGINTYIRRFEQEENPSVYVADAWLCNMYDRDV